MGQNSKIEWTDATWNPIRGCSMAKGSELGGCLNCYAARLNARNLPNLKSPLTGEPFARILSTGPRWTGKIELIESTLPLPLRWKQALRIFVNSQSDLFHEDLPFEEIDRVMNVMMAAPQHTYKVLTKRPEIALRYFASRPPLQHLWLGVSAEDQSTANTRIPLLMDIPAAIRFLSYEPALGPVHLGSYPGQGQGRLNWVIAGGESGPGARAAHPDWFRQVRDACAAADVPFFFKQYGAWIPGSAATYQRNKSKTSPVLDGATHLERPAAYIHSTELLNNMPPKTSAANDSAAASTCSARTRSELTVITASVADCQESK